MRDYKLYCLDGAKRIQRAADVISAADDEEAVRLAKAFQHPMPCELWDGRRLVATIPPAVQS